MRSILRDKITKNIVYYNKDKRQLRDKVLR